MGETVRVPMVAKMIRHEDGSYSIDKENSRYAEVPAETLAGMIIHEFQREQRMKETTPN